MHVYIERYPHKNLIVFRSRMVGEDRAMIGDCADELRPGQSMFGFTYKQWMESDAMLINVTQIDPPIFTIVPDDQVV